MAKTVIVIESDEAIDIHPASVIMDDGDVVDVGSGTVLVKVRKATVADHAEALGLSAEDLNDSGSYTWDAGNRAGWRAEDIESDRGSGRNSHRERALEAKAKAIADKFAEAARRVREAQET